MKYVELPSLPNDGYNVAASFYGELNNKILLGGGSGFISPLATGGAKLISNSLWWLTEENGQWKIWSKAKVVLHEKDYGFCNGVSVATPTAAYFIGGLKFVDKQIVNSADVLKVWIENEQLQYQIYENVLPFAGEVIGAQISDSQVFVLAGKNAFTVSLPVDNSGEFKVKKHELSQIENNPCIAVAANQKILLIGGYYPFDVNQKISNQFVEDQLIVWDGSNVLVKNFKNLVNQSFAFLGGSAFYESNNSVLIVGGVDNAVFTDAILNLSTLKGDELAAFKSKYFNQTEQEFGFNKHLLKLDLNTNTLTSLGTFNHGFAGNPSILKFNQSYYLLTSEVKAGVRLANPIKFSL